jgi:hypothetical protein
MHKKNLINFFLNFTAFSLPYAIRKSISIDLRQAKDKSEKATLWRYPNSLFAIL